MPQWRRNLYILFVVQLLSTAGFSLVFPFLPLYVKEVGVSTGGSIEFWAGLVFSSQALTMMISAPIWGVVADRYGRKPMIVRASLGGAITIAAMGFVQNAEQLVILRVIQGLVTGTIAASNALVAASTPKERSGESLGLLQMGTWVGIAIGPILGGIIGDQIGFRESFWITAVLLGVAAVAVIVGVHEDFTRQPRAQRPSMRSSYGTLLHAPDMASLYSASFLHSLGRSVIFPVAALFMIELMHSDGHVATMTGVMMGSYALIGSVSATWMGRLGDRIGHSKVLFGGMLFGVLCYFPQPFVTTAWQLVVLQAITGLSMGAFVPSLGALMNLRTPQGSQGATYGLDNSIQSAARMVAPLLGAGIAVWFGARGVFGMAVIIYIMAAFVGLHIWRASVLKERVAAAQPVPSGGDD
ncbi:MAG: MFS transporter [Caldilineaceae bacterium]|nr:MFS transporter [Caldilineaceae bacterium]